MFTEQTFNLPALTGISQKTIEEHLKLYAGYVKHSNIILEKIKEYSVDSEKNAYVLGELQRRFGFEYDGMRNHEYYFKLLEGGPKEISDSSLKTAIAEQWGSFDAWLARFKAIAMTRGIGWAILSYDPVSGKLVNSWVEEQHVGHLNGNQFIFGIDMWEHSYMLDYVPSEKKKYVEAFMQNVNWSVAEGWFEDCK